MLRVHVLYLFKIAFLKPLFWTCDLLQPTRGQSRVIPVKDFRVDVWIKDSSTQWLQ